MIGLELPFFLNRTLMLMLWAPIVAVGAAVGAAWQRSRPIGLVLAALVLLITWPGTANLLQGTWEYDVSFQHLEAVARPGDVVAVVPSWYAPVAEWRVEVRKPLGSTTPVRVAGIPDAVSFRIDGAPATGRIVLLEFGASRPDLHSFGRCAPVWTFSETRIRCLVPRRGS